MNAPPTSIWTTLGVSAHAGETEIRRAYARLLKTTRPDDDPEAFQALRQAYERAMQLAAGTRKRAEQDPSAPAAAPAAPVKPVAPQARTPSPALPAQLATRTQPIAANTIAHAALQRLIASREAPASHPLAVVDLLGEPQLANLAVRDTFEMQCATYCASAKADSALRLELGAAFEWERDPSYLLRMQPRMGAAALSRLRGDLLYQTIFEFDQEITRLLSGPPVSISQAQRSLLEPTFLAKLNKAFELLRPHPAEIIGCRFDRGTLSFWETQARNRFASPIWMSSALLITWLMTVIGMANQSMWGTPLISDKNFQWSIVVAIVVAIFGPSLAWQHWPVRARAWYRTAREQPAYRYGWLALWFAGTVATLEGPALASPSMQIAGIASLLAAGCWALAVVPRALEPWALLFSPVLAALLCAQTWFSAMYDARLPVWSVVQGPLIAAFLVMRPEIALRLRTQRGIAALAALGATAALAALGLSIAQQGLRVTWHGWAPFMMPLLALAAMACPSLENRGKWVDDRYVVGLGILVMNVPAVEWVVVPVLLIGAALNSAYAALIGKQAAAQTALRNWLTFGSTRYRREAFRTSNIFSALFTVYLGSFLVIGIVAANLQIPVPAFERTALRPAATSTTTSPATTAPASARAAVPNHDGATASLGPQAQLDASPLWTVPAPFNATFGAIETDCIARIRGNRAPAELIRQQQFDSWADQLVCMLQNRLRDMPAPNTPDGKVQIQIELREDGTIGRYTLAQSSGSADWDRTLLRHLHDLGQLPDPAGSLVPRRLTLPLRFATASSAHQTAAWVSPQRVPKTRA